MAQQQQDFQWEQLLLQAQAIKQRKQLERESLLKDLSLAQWERVV